MELVHRIKYKIFVYKNLTSNPGSPDYVVSDLFAIRDQTGWQTYFELLNINSLLKADFSNDDKSESVAIMYFYDSDGIFLGAKDIGLHNVARQSIHINPFLKSNLSKAALFAVFHKVPLDSTMLGESLIAERGYVGYEFNSNGARSYVHGNHDAIASNGVKTQLIGNYGFRSRYYYVQHPLDCSAKYDFIFVNTSSKEQKLKFQISSENQKWQTIGKVFVKPGGSYTLPIASSSKGLDYLRIKSKLYLARPVVFRQTQHSFDVFHG
jgi:hypothetical protein